MTYNALKVALKNGFHQLLANYCYLCGQSIPSSSRICAACLTHLPYLSDQPIEVSSLGISIPSGQTITDETDLFNRIYCEFSYAYPIDKIITRLKFNHELIAARILGEQLASGLRYNHIERPDILLPVPLHNRRLRQRGFNQAHEIAKEVGIRLSIPVSSQHVIRATATHAQSDLQFDQRQSNIHGAFKLIKPFQASHVAIIDDVMTTGATSLELCRTLKAGGVERISIWCCAHAQLKTPSFPI